MKEFESDDPMELQGIWIDGDPNYMLDCVVEEYLRLGWPPEQILRLFESPSYPVLHQMLRARGGEALRARIQQIAKRCGVFRFRTSEPPEDPELVTIAPMVQGESEDE